MSAIAAESLSLPSLVVICGKIQHSKFVKLIWLWVVMACALDAEVVSDVGSDVAAAQSVQRKLDAIEHGTLQPGSNVWFSAAELESWMKEEAKYWTPQGVRDLRLHLEEGAATGFARIDFLKLKQVDGEEPGFLLRTLLSGERPVTVSARFVSRNGQARVDVERVEVSGFPLEGKGLQLLIQTYLWATFPEARAGEWFALDRHVDHFEVHASGVAIVMKTMFK